VIEATERLIRVVVVWCRSRCRQGLSERTRRWSVLTKWREGRPAVEKDSRTETDEQLRREETGASLEVYYVTNGACRSVRARIRLSASGAFPWKNEEIFKGKTKDRKNDDAEVFVVREGWGPKFVVDGRGGRLWEGDWEREVGRRERLFKFGGNTG
jgi:hypothetical protein